MPLKNLFRRAQSFARSPEATVVLNTPPEFVRALVDDLRKAGAITGNDKKMRRA